MCVKKFVVVDEDRYWVGLRTGRYYLPGTWYLYSRTGTERPQEVQYLRVKDCMLQLGSIKMMMITKYYYFIIKFSNYNNTKPCNNNSKL